MEQKNTNAASYQCDIRALEKCRGAIFFGFVRLSFFPFRVFSVVNYVINRECRDHNNRSKNNILDQFRHIIITPFDQPGHKLNLPVFLLFFKAKVCFFSDNVECREAFFNMDGFLLQDLALERG